MIYLDNAATTLQKPPAVVEAVAAALTSFGGSGRGVHGPSLAASMAVYEAREELAALLGAPDASRVAFTHNATEALNMAIAGLVGPDTHAITTAASHNSVLRPLYRAQEAGAALTIVDILPDGSLDWSAYEAAFHRFPNKPCVVVATHASNLTGDVYDIERMARMAHAHGALMVVDAAQTAGVIPIDMEAQGLDAVCFTGHKSLFGPQGTGGLALSQQVELPPYNVGGSGIRSFDTTHPTAMPEHLEAGTLNAHGIAGLAAGVRFVRDVGVEVIHKHELELAKQLEDGLRAIPEARILGGGTGCKTGVVAFNLGQLDSGEVASALEQEYGICTRAGAHCAPLMHQALGTQEQGAVRASFSWFNTKEQVDTALEALYTIARSITH